MRWWLPVLFVLAVVIAAAIWWPRSSPAPVVAVTSPVPITTPVAPPAEPAPPVVPKKKRYTGPQPTPEEWATRRDNAQSAWDKAIREAAAAEFAVLDPAERQAALTALDTYAKATVQVRQQMASRKISARQGMHTGQTLRREFHDTLKGLMGEEVDNVRKRLNAKVYGGAW